MSFGFTYTPTSGIRPLLVNFSGTSDGRDNPYFIWDFGDGDSASGITTSHSYATSGIYYPTLTLASGTGYYFNEDFEFLDPLLTNCVDSGLFSDNFYLSRTNDQGMLSCTDGSERITIFDNISGYWSVTAEVWGKWAASLRLEMTGVLYDTRIYLYNDDYYAYHNGIKASSGHLNQDMSLKFKSTPSGIYWYVRDGGSGPWLLFHSGIYSLDSVQAFNIETGRRYKIKSLLVEADYGLPYSGSPYTDYNTWFYSNFDYPTSTSGYLNDTFWNSVEINTDGIASGVNLNTGDQISDIFSGEFEFVSKIYSNTNEFPHGWRIIDNSNTSDYFSFQYASGPDNLHVAKYHYDPNESAVYIPSSSGYSPWEWWGKIEKTDLGSGYNISVYWASGNLDSVSDSDWMLFSSGAVTSSWYIPSGSFDEVYVAPIIPTSGDLRFSDLTTYYPAESLEDSGVIYVTGEDFSITGYLDGVGSIFSSFTYIARPLPAGTTFKTILPILSNRRTSPYYAGSTNDYLQAKLEMYNKHRLSYEPDIPVELWLNYTTSWQPYASGVTNRYGIAHLNYPCLEIPDIDFCLGVAKITYKGKTYNSNIVRFNFIQVEDSIYEIDAGSCLSPLVDRSSHDIFDASSRTGLVIDRMYGGS